MTNDKYREFVEHPRFGWEPQYTGMNPQTDYGGDTFLHWHSPKSCRIPNTAIAANIKKQMRATVAVTHYYDAKRQCRDCRRMFIFFAAEQQHWYEVLQFGLESNCVRCVPCRKRQQGIAQLRDQYESLYHQPERDEQESLTMAECCLSLIEGQVFTIKQCQRVRSLINSVHHRDFTNRINAIRQRLAIIEADTQSAE